MHPRIAELLAYVDSQTGRLRTAFERIPADRRGTRPAPDRWSPAENIHHLTIVERRLTHRIAGLIEEARKLAPEDDTTSLFPMIAANKVETRDQRFTTSEASEPSDTDASRVWEDFAGARKELTAVISTGDGLRLGAVSAPHPVLGAFSAYEWIAFVGAHAARHAQQIEEIPE